ncbi:hypothetical protein IWX90DRAFT_64576 [Phyllosticta citrichinensis]|uniref:Uncharacterized protein n=1 Tax=Phyllosticta citrichinensis TaxID=1130410 RepID=A0ABR1XHF2_9PEZI
MPQERIDGSSSSTAGETAAAATYAIPPSLKSTSPCVPPPERPRATKEKIHQPAHPLAAASPTPPPRIHPRVPLPPFPFVTSPCLSSTRSAAPQLLAPGPSRHLVSSSRPRRTGCRYTQLASQSVTQPEPILWLARSLASTPGLPFPLPLHMLPVHARGPCGAPVHPVVSVVRAVLWQ